ncbi:MULTISPECIES: 2-oxo-4-hydroxy-4-carboxy-5-ureidoimidazoline decarboxylase [Desertifilum]|uniref:2-oxo-4-hydroxy-4-carboxy-5-ureidoimidazoline decarboxylase n=1 Tax=Desertifilum tharense IPPAS B-1220 TaxID=1781255 RepID=A0A1E5QJN0_9CYAN|nr:MULTISPECIES: 2-oxo-4-hydroxy-4-carboxy-5-ureidoimidazoline decarboxylase [Desertifilum]MDA0210933.1 2-oxo-4-hydroxy-4-carboxy-5-ureidoimidazoline decarboxylase [Cyanobacteria bacterium FC1]OEJ74899.1 OHCU decarboxylase [Desertifilum tharense IPPAS B-1220]
MSEQGQNGLSVARLNQMAQAEFVDAVGWVFEHSPWVAYRAWELRPFANLDVLHQTMVDVVQQATEAEKLALLQAHPDLGAKVKMAEASVQEQAGAGLDQLTPQESDRFFALNQAYQEKFGFPFIIAVKNHTKTSILEAFSRRLDNSIPEEQATALAEVAKIAEFRLAQVFKSS